MTQSVPRIHKNALRQKHLPTGPQLRDDHDEWSKIDCFNYLFLFLIYFYNSRNKNKVFVFVRFDVLLFN